MLPIQHYIDYTILKPGTTSAQVEELCKTAIQEGYKTVCVPPCYVEQAAAWVAGSSVLCCSVVGFPHGMHLTETKLEEATALFRKGARELDLVSNLSLLRNKDYAGLRYEIGQFQRFCASKGLVSKVIIESGLLDFGEIKTICEICTEAGVNFVKTSTGFAAVGAELDKVRYLREILPEPIQLKASGGIRDYDTARAFIEVGATRIGTSALIKEL